MVPVTACLHSGEGSGSLGGGGGGKEGQRERAPHDHRLTTSIPARPPSMDVAPPSSSLLSHLSLPSFFADECVKAEGRKVRYVGMEGGTSGGDGKGPHNRGLGARIDLARP